MAKSAVNRRLIINSRKVKKLVKAMRNKMAAVAPDVPVIDTTTKPLTGRKKSKTPPTSKVVCPVNDPVKGSGLPACEIMQFTVFRHLPIELRNLIWQLSMEEGRVVQLIRNELSFGVGAYFSRTPPPAQLHVCHESRKQALKVYKQAFAAHAAATPIYFNFTVDTVYFDHGPDFPNDHIFFSNQRLPVEDFQKVRYLAASMMAVNYHHFLNFGNYRSFPSLLKLTVVAQVRQKSALTKGSLYLVDEGPYPQWFDFGSRIFPMIMGSLQSGTGAAED